MDACQCARFCDNLRLVHERTVKCIAKYLASTSTYVDLPEGNWLLTTLGVVYRPGIEKFIGFYVDANFDIGWDQADSDNV